MVATPRNRSLSLILGFLLIVSAVFFFTPILKMGLPIMGLEFVFLLLAISQTGSRYSKKNAWLVLCIYLYLLLCLFYRAVGISSVAPGTLVLHLFFFVAILLTVLFPHRITAINDTVFLAILFIIILNIADNIRLCLKYPEIYLLVNRDMDSVGATLNIGSSKFYNAIFFFNTVCFFGFLNCKEKKIKYCLLAGVLLSAVFLFAFCLKASVIVFTVLSLFLLFFAKRAKNMRQFSIRILVPALFAYVIVSVFSEEIIGFMSNIFASPRLVARLSLLIDPDSAEAARGTGTVSARGNLWMMSVNTWTESISNFVFGIGDHRAVWSQGQTAVETGIGQHSDFLDSLARYGLLGVFILVPTLFLGFRFLISVFNKEYKLQILVIALVFVMFGFTKGVFQPDIGFLLFIFLPMMSKYLNRPETRVMIQRTI